VTGKPGRGIADTGDLLALAYQIEVEAVDRYHLLADQMDVCNNTELAGLFRKLADIEGLHARDLLEQAGGQDAIKVIDVIDLDWEGGDTPESIDLSKVHYLMTPWHAVQLALAAEKRAFAFFENLKNTVDDAELRAMAAEFADEERAHVDLMEAELAKYPQPEPGWDDDLDPAEYQE
jgi:rubrerythrin